MNIPYRLGFCVLIYIAGSVVLIIIFGMSGFQAWTRRQDEKKAERIIQQVVKAANMVPPVRTIVTGKSEDAGDPGDKFALAVYRSHSAKVVAIIRFDNYRDVNSRKLIDVAVHNPKVRDLVITHFRNKDGHDVGIWADDSFRVFVPIVSSV